MKENFLRNAALDPKKYGIYTRPFKMWWEDDDVKEWWNAQFMFLSFDPKEESCALVLYQVSCLGDARARWVTLISRWVTLRAR